MRIVVHSSWEEYISDREGGCGNGYWKEEDGEELSQNATQIPLLVEKQIREAVRALLPSPVSGGETAASLGAPQRF